MKMIILAADHGGYKLKNEIKEHLSAQGREVLDLGVNTDESIDYPDVAELACRRFLDDGNAECVFLFCGTGIGIAIAANKVKGIRAATCYDENTASLAKEHNDANVICMGGRVLEREGAIRIVEGYLGAAFSGGRHGKRIAKIAKIEGQE